MWVLPCGMAAEGATAALPADDRLRASGRGGAMVGGLFAVFHAVQLGSSIFHGQRSYRDTVAAGMATGAAFGAFGAWPSARLTMNG